jgi:hypothetical protein
MTNEKTEVIEITPLPEEGNIQVAYDRQVLEGEQVISRKLHYELYSMGKKDQFIADIENPDNGGTPGKAAPYIAAVGW